MARIHLAEGKWDEFAKLLLPLSPKDLIKEGLWTPLINGLWLHGQQEEALRLASKTTQDHPDLALGWVVLSDIQRAQSEFKTARKTLNRAIEVEANPDAWLLRRAWIAHLNKDNMASLTHLRRQLEISPYGGSELWFYTRLYAQTPYQDLVRSDKILQNHIRS